MQYFNHIFTSYYLLQLESGGKERKEELYVAGHSTY